MVNYGGRLPQIVGKMPRLCRLKSHDNKQIILTIYTSRELTNLMEDPT